MNWQAFFGTIAVCVLLACISLVFVTFLDWISLQLGYHKGTTIGVCILVIVFATIVGMLS